MFTYDLSDELKQQLKLLFKKNKSLYSIILKKIEQIIMQDHETINHYKNLRYDLSDCKRVHIDKSFVLLFKVYLDKNFILFYKFDHHDNVYKN